MSGFLSAGAQLIDVPWMITKILFAGSASVLALYIVYVVVHAVVQQGVEFGRRKTFAVKKLREVALEKLEGLENVKDPDRVARLTERMELEILKCMKVYGNFEAPQSSGNVDVVIRQHAEEWANKRLDSRPPPGETLRDVLEMACIPA